MRRILLRQTWGGRGGTASTDLNLCEFLLSSISLFYQPIFGHFLPFYYPARITLRIVEVLKTFVVHKLSCPTCPREQFPELFPNKKGHYLEQTAVSTTCCYCTVQLSLDTNLNMSGSTNKLLLTWFITSVSSFLMSLWSQSLLRNSMMFV